MEEIKKLIRITSELRKKYPSKKFSLDGKLIGDIGEILVAKKYGIKLYPENYPVHDGEEKTSGRKVQIKASFKSNSYFPHGENRKPDYFLSVNILESGEIEELFNGSGQYIYDNYISKRKLKPYKNTYYTLSKGILQKLNKQVPVWDKIKIL